jgi:predicted nuclease of predicted toxin-antitoxin system
MIIWVDAQLPPAIADWISSEFRIQAVAVRHIGLRFATDRDIFFTARHQAAVIMTKDSDFVRLVDEHGPPPQVIWITCGNTSNTRLQEILEVALPKAIQLLQAGEKLVEIRGTP